MRILGFLSSLLVILSFLLPWLNLPSGKMTFIDILVEMLTSPNGFEGAFQWLNSSSTGSIFTYVAFFAALLMIILSIFFGFLGGRLGPSIGLVGMLLFTVIVWYFYGQDFPKILGEGYLLALGSFVVGLLLGGGKYL